MVKKFFTGIFFVLLSAKVYATESEYICDGLSNEDEGVIVYDQKFLDYFNSEFMDWTKVKSIYSDAKKTIEKLKDSETPFVGTNDYITLKKGEDYFSYYVNIKNNTGALDCASFSTGRISDSDFISFDKSVEFYKKKWSIKNKVEIIEITNLERVEMVKLYFHGDSLAKVTYKLMYKG